MTAQQVNVRDRERERANTRDCTHAYADTQTRKPPHLFTQQYVLMVNTNTKYVLTINTRPNNNTCTHETHNISKQHRDDNKHNKLTHT